MKKLGILDIAWFAFCMIVLISMGMASFTLLFSDNLVWRVILLILLVLCGEHNLKYIFYGLKKWWKKSAKQMDEKML